ncbi:MAG: CHC2 zinc finger domain-containing protein [Desulfoprunum sp.]|jgi:5S rRNA maturation endonuclease (ribonuclease M5)
MLMTLIEKDGLGPKKKTGAEYASPCPSCGGRDRFVIHADTWRYWCRGCGKSGDALQYLRDFHGMSFPDAAALVGKQLSPNRQSRPAKMQPAPKPTPASQPAAWRERAALGIARAHENLLGNDEVLEWLRLSRGITRETAERFNLGWLTKDRFFWRGEFGLEPDGPKKKMVVPSGLLIPWRDQRIRVRRNNAADAEKFGRYHLVSGSVKDPFLIGDPYENTAIIVESELDAILLSQELTRPAFVVAMGSTSNRPDTELIDKLSSCPVVLVAMDTDEAGSKAWKWWTDNVPGVFRAMTPAAIGSDITEAFLAGLDLNEWLGVSMEFCCEAITETDETDAEQPTF